MKTSFSKLLCLLAGPLLAVSLAHGADNSPSWGDKSFVKKAAIGGMFEVISGKLAQEKASSQDVKDFAAKMVEDHGKAGDELKSIATSKGIDLPDSLDMLHKAMVDSLGMKSGADFDKAYLADMTKAHNGDDALFMKEAAHGKDADLKAFASKTDEMVKHHIMMLNDVKSKVK
jgi:putative membrane protein